MATKVQSVLLPKSKHASRAAACAWAKAHGWKCTDVDDDGDHYRFRQRDPSGFARLRTIPIAGGLAKLVVGVPK